MVAAARTSWFKVLTEVGLRLHVSLPVDISNCRLAETRPSVCDCWPFCAPNDSSPLVNAGSLPSSEGCAAVAWPAYCGLLADAAARVASSSSSSQVLPLAFIHSPSCSAYLQHSQAASIIRKETPMSTSIRLVTQEPGMSCPAASAASSSSVPC